jgi:tryptophan halogenase
MTGRPLKTVVVAGGGIAGWSAAAALKRRVPTLDLTILPIAPGPDALTDRIAATLPSIMGFHRDLGIGLADAVVRTGSSYRLGTRFGGWSDRPDYVHAYGPAGRPLATASFHLHWIREAHAGRAAAFDSFCGAAALARLGRVADPAEAMPDALAGLEYGLTLDLAGYAAMLRAFAGHCGVIERPRGLRGATLDADGRIDALVLDDDEKLRADLYIDCTGPAARLRSAIDDRRDDWRRWLPCDRVLFGEPASGAQPSPLDEADAWSAGWRWTSHGARDRTQGVVYASDHASEDDAARVLDAPAGPPMAIAAGNRTEPWRGNCVAIGEAATVIEPLEWTNLHLAHSAIDRLIAMLPDAECAAVEAADYNRQAVAEAERVRDFVALHYAVAKRDEPFWRACAAAPLPDSLAHTLALFRERGRLPFYEEETFARDSWLTLLFGQGELPRRVDPLVRSVSDEPARHFMADWQAAIAASAPSHPPLAGLLGAQHRHVMQ